MEFSNPAIILDDFGLTKGSVVADLGAGSGVYSLSVAELVGEAGQVYAVDVQRELVENIKHLAKDQGAANLEVVWGDLERSGGTRLKEASVDVAIVANVLFQLEDISGFVAELSRILKSDGRVLVVDWSDSYGGIGPAADMIITEAEATELFTRAGFKVKRRLSTAGDHHYALECIRI